MSTLLHETLPANWNVSVVSAAVYAAKEFIRSSITAWQRDCYSRLQCCWMVDDVKMPPLRCILSSKFFDYLLLRVSAAVTRRLRRLRVSHDGHHQHTPLVQRRVPAAVRLLRTAGERRAVPPSTTPPSPQLRRGCVDGGRRRLSRRRRRGGDWLWTVHETVTRQRRRRPA